MEGCAGTTGRALELEDVSAVCLHLFISSLQIAGDVYKRPLIRHSQDTNYFQTQPIHKMAVKGTVKIGLASDLREPSLPKDQKDRCAARIFTTKLQPH